VSRRALGPVLAAAAALTALGSACVAWYDGRTGTGIRLRDLFAGLTPTAADLVGSLLVPLALAAVLAAAGIALRRRRLWALGGLITVATTVLWAVRQAQAATGLHSGAVGPGPWLALAAGAGLWLAAAVAAPRRRRGRRRIESAQLSPGWAPAAGTAVGQTEGTAEPSRVEQLQPRR
jgi:hypothetical protein